MGIEIERKFLVKDNSWLDLLNGKGVAIRQGYLSNCPESVVRIRVAGEKGFITVKGKNCNLSRLEFEYEIPFQDAIDMLALCLTPLVEKVRYQLNFMGFEWCVDKFEGMNQGLIIAEIELETEIQPFEKPPWAGDEVTADPRYFNSNLINHPFQNW